MNNVRVNLFTNILFPQSVPAAGIEWFVVSDQTNFSLDVCTFILFMRRSPATVGTQLSKTPDSDSAISNAIKIVET